jgi:hypothetical protein
VGENTAEIDSWCPWRAEDDVSLCGMLSAGFRVWQPVDRSSAGGGGVLSRVAARPGVAQCRECREAAAPPSPSSPSLLTVTIEELDVSRSMNSLKTGAKWAHPVKPGCSAALWQRPAWGGVRVLHVKWSRLGPGKHPSNNFVLVRIQSLDRLIAPLSIVLCDLIPLKPARLSSYEKPTTVSQALSRVGHAAWAAGKHTGRVLREKP